VNDTVTITGVGFGSSSKLFFGGNGTSPGTVAGTITSRASTQMTAKVPTGGYGRVTVRNGTTSTSPVTWAAVDLTRLAVTGISSAEGPTGVPVTVTGTGFADTDAVTFNGHAVTADASDDGTQISFTVPDGGWNFFGESAIVVTAPEDTGRPGTTAYTVNFGISSIAPPSGPIGRSLTIDGTFPTAHALAGALNGTAFAIDTVSSTRITAHVPFDATTGKITITDTITDKVVTSPTAFTVTLKLDPHTGPTGTLVTAAGLNFTGINHVTIAGHTGNVDATPSSPVADHLTFTIPADVPTGSADVTIQPVQSNGDPLGSPSISPFVVTAPDSDPLAPPNIGS
jgi:hypothetical protein